MANEIMSQAAGRSSRSQIQVRAIEVADRLETMRLQRDDLVSNNPLAFPMGPKGYVVLFRFGVAVMFGLTPVEEEKVLADLAALFGPKLRSGEQETITIEVSADREDYVAPGGPIYLKTLTAERVLVISDIIAKSVALARDEREVSAALDGLEPLARRLAEMGKTTPRRRDMLQKIGQALLARQRVVGRVAAEEKPDVLWDRPDLERLFARMEDEFEIRERASALHSKLAVIGDTATALTDLLDTERSLRLEMAIVGLIVFEILFSFYQLFATLGKTH